MKKTKITATVVLALCLMVWSAPIVYGAQSLTVNGHDVKSITLEVGQSCTVEVVSDDSRSYTDYIGFDNGLVRGTFLHVETMPAAGNSADVTEYNERAFYGYYIVADGLFRPPSAGIHFVFEYEAQEVGETNLKLYQNNPPPLAGPLLDSVHIAVIPAPMGTAITYQGSLNDAGSPADGPYDFQFKLYDSITGGNQEGNTIDIDDVDVIEGQFVVELDFGSDPNIFGGDARWLQVGVRPGDSNGVHTRLSPRIELMPTPYALYAKTAETAEIAGGIPGGITGSGTANYVAKFTSANTLGNSTIYESTGRVGIGTMYPWAGLHLRGTGYPNSFMYLQSDANEDTGFRLYEDTAVKWHLFNDSALDGLSLRNNAYSPVLFVEQSSGNVGIGTINPLSKLSVGGDGYADTGVYGYGDFGVYGVGESLLGKPSAGVCGRAKATNSFGFLGYGNYGGYFDGDGYFSGKVGIGTSSPDAGLHLKATGYPSSFMYLQSDSGQDTGFRLYEGDTIKWHIFNNSADDSLEIRNNAYSPVLIAEQSTGIVSVRVLEITGGSDLSEQFEVSDEGGKVKPGMVVCIDAANPGNLVVSKESYDRTVAGIVSGAGEVKPGMLMGQKGTEADGDHPVALTGRVYCWADASNGSIEPGDLLTTSDVPGHAMKVTDYNKSHGATLGKAMTSLREGKGLVLVLVSLQ